MNSLNTFNWLAGFYDRLVKIIFGDSLNNAQLVYLKDIPPEANVLILGGGTGLILKELGKINQSCSVWYIEASSAMIKQAKKNIRNSNQQVRIYFIHGTENEIPDGIEFDAVITNFFLDLFSASVLEKVIQKIKPSLATQGIWLVSDFVTPSRYWQKILLNMMYFFFRKTCDIESSHLPPWELKLGNAGLVQMKSKMFFCSFVKSAVFVLAKD